MVGFVDPNPTKQPEKPPPESWWKGAFINPIQVKRPAQGKFSPKTDERCFTWCSQSVRGRAEGQDPWCRSLCIRRVFEHEVRQLTSHFSHDSAYHSRALAGKGPALKYPLPPEGQPQPSSSSLLADDEGAPVKEKAERYWEEGWYVWMTKNRWAAQEKMDLMMLDLERQTNWMRMKEQEERAWAEDERQTERDGFEHGHGYEHEPTAVIPDGLDDGQDGPPRHPYPNAAEESFLMRIPTRIPISEYAQHTLAPTWKVLGIVRTSVESGNQKDLALRAWNLAWDGAPFTLVKNVFKTCMDSFKNGPNDDNS